MQISRHKVQDRKILIHSRSGLLFQSWWVWLVAGLVFCALSLFVQNDILSIIIGGFAFCCLWGIHEMFLQEKRVLRGWFPENPKRHAYYEARRKELGING